ncbi:GAF domain-containing protein [Rathayibacter tanaceti]|uniref:GAF domain-containing protein n=2 Tax=Rathayibacter tanaceti TaxID=1671680 RepID=A0A168GAF3_9MICO|nr:hypothetical protein ACH61_00881 [Rathayibacter tanaceti]TCO33764.1 GAF domain-containing protein [Rathayibacter tanaceti]
MLTPPTICPRPPGPTAPKVTVRPPALLRPQAPHQDLASLLRLLPRLIDAEGAAVASLGGLFGEESVAASSPAASRLDAEQVRLGQGPSWDAFETALPVQLRAARAADRLRWPLLAAPLREEGIAVVAALPLRFGPLEIGALTVYRSSDAAFDEDHLRLAADLAVLVSRSILARHAEGRDPVAAPHRVHEGAETLARLTGLSQAESLLAMQAYAARTGDSLLDVAAGLSASRSV